MGRTMRRIVSAAFVVAAFAATAVAQQQGGAPDDRERRDAPAPSARANVDETFELNITERRIAERDFYAATAIEAGEANARGLSLRVGVTVGASEIDVLLRNVRGRVRFRGSLEALRRVLDARRSTAAAVAAAAATGATQPGVP